MRNNFEEQLGNLKEAAGAEIAPQLASLQQASLSFVATTEMVDLPSRGRFYPENHPLFNKESVEIKQMTAKEEDILTNKSFIKKGILIDKLLESIILDKTIGPSSLLVGDKNAIMIAARMTAYGSEYEIGINCIECGAKNTTTVDLLQTKIKDIETIDAEKVIDYTRLPDGTFSFKLPKCGWVVCCKLLNGEDEKNLINLLDAKKKNSFDNEISLSEQLYFIIHSINDIKDKKVIQDAIAMMPAFDAKFLRTTYAKLIPNISILKKFVCSSCKDEQEVEVPFTQEFFWPK